jgi:hypothetical protein
LTPKQLLAAARELITRPDSATAGVWPRTSALLARQALEQALDSRWAAQPETSPLRQASTRSQLICLPAYLDPALAHQIAYTWAALSNACHYHPYELAPTSTELTAWISDVATLISRIEDSA